MWDDVCVTCYGVLWQEILTERLRNGIVSVIENDFVLVAMEKHAKTTYKPLGFDKEVLCGPVLRK